MGVTITPGKLEDPQIMAFLLGTEPIGLKPGAERDCGMKMRDFEEVVRPYFDRRARAFFFRAIGPAKRVPPPAQRLKREKGLWKIYRPQPLPRRIAGVMRSIALGQDVDFRKKWRALEEDQRAALEREMGEKFPPFSFADVPKRVQIEYAGRDPDATLRRYHVLRPKIKAMGLEQVLKIDLGVVPIISRMQTGGMLLDIPFTRAMSSRLQEEGHARADELRDITKRGFLNPGSPDQIRTILFEQFRLPVGRLTSKGRKPSTDDKSLERLLIHTRGLGPASAFIRALQTYREVRKFDRTFVAPLPAYADARGRLHPNIRLTKVVSGRPSTFDPNFLSMPKRSALGKEVRNCFTAEEGYVIVSLDFSQIELRMMAHESGDPEMTRAFKQGLDLHARTAQLLFRIALEEVDELQHRYPAKTINFAVMYGITARALYEQLLLAGVLKDGKRPYTIEECDALIRQWFGIFGSVRDYLRSKHAETRRFGFVRDMWGRIRYLPNIHLSANGSVSHLRFEAERQAGNFPIQAGATGWAKIKLAELDQHLHREGLKDIVRPLLWIHDEFLFEVPEPRALEFARTAQRIMEEDRGRFRVPIKADFQIGPRWGSLKKAA